MNEAPGKQAAAKPIFALEFIALGPSWACAEWLFQPLIFASVFDGMRQVALAVGGASTVSRLPLRAVFLAFHGCRRRRE
ncbi:hypothetical protein QB898_02680 [Ottowia sp. 10c7w1]|uniref:Uncharacterized protein n=1 Tax=Ottowia cancrivicina TaxID=3040346 RepID=A0AAW6RIH9_9BURK|nr:hypothetical protein [Ottowia sp. 10c7w1]